MTSMICGGCNERVLLGVEDFECPRCGKKLRETIEEMNAEIARQQTAHTIRRARLYLLICGLLQLGWTGFLYLALASSWEDVPAEVKTGIYVSGGIAAGLLGCWLWAALQPVPATLVALVGYGGLVLASIVAEPAQVLGSPLATFFHALVIAALVSGVLAAFKHRRLTRS